MDMLQRHDGFCKSNKEKKGYLFPGIELMLRIFQETLFYIIRNHAGGYLSVCSKTTEIGIEISCSLVQIEADIRDLLIVGETEVTYLLLHVLHDIRIQNNTPIGKLYVIP